jgi:hypothetical protein
LYLATVSNIMYTQVPYDAHHAMLWLVFTYSHGLEPHGRG